MGGLTSTRKSTGDRLVTAKRGLRIAQVAFWLAAIGTVPLILWGTTLEAVLGFVVTFFAYVTIKLSRLNVAHIMAARIAEIRARRRNMPDPEPPSVLMEAFRKHNPPTPPKSVGEGLRFIPVIPKEGQQ